MSSSSSTYEQSNKQGPSCAQRKFQPFDAARRQEIEFKLRSKLEKGILDSRKGPGNKTLVYIRSDRVIDQANKIFSFNGWSDEIKLIQQDYALRQSNNKIEIGVRCITRVTLSSGSFHEDVGYGSGFSGTPGQAFQNVSKEAASDARKRALRIFGQALGNCIYDKSYRDSLRNEQGEISDETNAILQAMHNLPKSSSSSETGEFGNIPFTEQETGDIQGLLNQYLPVEAVLTRPGPCNMKLTYLESQMAIRIANSIFGFGNWSCEIKLLKLEYADHSGGKWRIGVTANVRITLRDGTFHEDVGFDEGVQRNRKEAAEQAYKSAVSDARKRALRLFGDGLGNCLYDQKYLKELERVNQKGSQEYTKAVLSASVISITADEAKLYEDLEREKLKRIEDDHKKKKEQLQKQQLIEKLPAHVSPSASVSSVNVNNTISTASSSNCSGTHNNNNNMNNNNMNNNNMNNDIITVPTGSRDRVTNHIQSNNKQSVEFDFDEDITKLVLANESILEATSSNIAKTTLPQKRILADDITKPQHQYMKQKQDIKQPHQQQQYNKNNNNNNNVVHHEDSFEIEFDDIFDDISCSQLLRDRQKENNPKNNSNTPINNQTNNQNNKVVNEVTLMTSQERDAFWNMDDILSTTSNNTPSTMFQKRQRLN